MKRIAAVMLVLALSFTATASAAKPGATGKNGGTYGPSAHHRHHHHIGVGQAHPASPRLKFEATATASKALGVEMGREFANWGLRKKYGVRWQYAQYKELTFMRKSNGRVRFRWLFSNAHSYSGGYITVWKSPYEPGSFYYYIEVKIEGAYYP